MCYLLSVLGATPFTFTKSLFGSALIGFSGALIDPICRQTIRTRLSHIPLVSRLIISPQLETEAARMSASQFEPMSIVLVLDISGSMAETSSDGTLKLDVLKEATRTLFETLERAYPEEVDATKYIRSGMTVYNDGWVSALSVDMASGWQGILRRTDMMEADGHTYSAEAFQKGVDFILEDPMSRHRQKRVLVFMSDGVNSDPEDAKKTRQICNKAKEDGLTIYSIAFEAPNEGKDLLMKCASNDNNPLLRRFMTSKYYFDAHNDSEFKEAFRQIGTR